jgi:microcystin-dependent protein
MADGSPSRVQAVIDAIIAPAGRDTVRIDVPFSFLSDEVKNAVVAALGLGTVSSLPAGLLAPFAGAAAPAGWLLCDGAAVSRTTYAVLFAAIGTAFGAGDGSTTFAVPDLRGRVPAGVDNMGTGAASRLTGATLAAGLGAETHALTEAEMAGHAHVTAMHTHQISYDMNGVTAGSDFNAVTAVGSGPANSPTEVSAEADTLSAGDDDGHNNVQPTLCVNYIIKT